MSDATDLAPLPPAQASELAGVARAELRSWLRAEPASALERIDRIGRDEIAGSAALIGRLVAAVTEVRQMCDQHLPQLVASYAEIPPAHRAEIFRATGRSASYKLNEALDRMIARIEALSRSLAQEDINSFADNLRFIEGRYGPGEP